MGPRGADASQRSLGVAAAFPWARSPHLSHRQRAIGGPVSRPQAQPDPLPLPPSAGHWPGISPPWSTPVLSSAPLLGGPGNSPSVPTVGRGTRPGGSRRSGGPARSSSRRLGAAPAGLPPPSAPRPRPRPDAPSGARAAARPAPGPRSRPRAPMPERVFRAAEPQPAAQAGHPPGRAAGKTRQKSRPRAERRCDPVRSPSVERALLELQMGRPDRSEARRGPETSRAQVFSSHPISGRFSLFHRGETEAQRGRRRGL